MKSLMAEKAGQMLRVEYSESEAGSFCKFWVNGNLVKEEVYEGKSIHWAESAAQNWIDGIKTLNG